MSHRIFAAMLRVALTSVCVLVVVGRAQAGLITYTHTATVTGTLGSSSFTDALFILVATADTASVQQFDADSYLVENLTLSFTIGGQTGEFTGGAGITVADNVLGAVEIILGRPRILVSDISSVAPYDLTSELGPIDTLASTDGFDYETTLGTLTLVSVGPRGTFTAALGAVAVPEPASAVTVGIALLVGPAALVLRRRRSA